jgi:hypothetical protein
MWNWLPSQANMYIGREWRDVGVPELLLLLWPLLRRLDQRLNKQRVLGDPIKGQQDEKITQDSNPEKQEGHGNTRLFRYL